MASRKTPPASSWRRWQRRLGVSLAWLAGATDVPEGEGPAASTYAAIEGLNVAASAGGGAVAEDYLTGQRYYFRREWIRNQLDATPGALKMIRISGDSMAPALMDGDTVLIDTSRVTPSPAGIFVLHDGMGLVAKRLELTGGEPPNVRIISDNQQYSTYERSLDETRIIGRVVWFAREL